MRFVMKLMGIGRLMGLTSSSDPALGGHARALIAELEHGRWNDEAEVRNRYPSAEVDGVHVTIHLDATHCVVLMFEYDSQLVLVRTAGPCQSARSSRKESRSQP